MGTREAVYTHDRPICFRAQFLIGLSLREVEAFLLHTDAFLAVLVPVHACTIFENPTVRGASAISVLGPRQVSDGHNVSPRYCCVEQRPASPSVNHCTISAEGYPDPSGHKYARTCSGAPLRPLPLGGSTHPL